MFACPLGWAWWFKWICWLSTGFSKHHRPTRQGFRKLWHCFPHRRHALCKWIHLTMGPIHSSSARNFVNSTIHDCKVLFVAIILCHWHLIRVLHLIRLKISGSFILQWKSWTWLAKHRIILWYSRFRWRMWSPCRNHVLFSCWE